MTTSQTTAACESAVIEPNDRDTLLVQKSLEGSTEAFEALFQAYYPKVHAIAHGVLLNWEEAEDAAQEVFALVFRNLGKFDRRSKFSTWLFRVTVNRAIQESRRGQKRRHNVDIDTAVERPQMQEEDHPLTGPVALVLAELPPADRAILAMFYWEEFSIAEIAESLDCRVNAAKTRLYRARERFRQIYESREIDV